MQIKTILSDSANTTYQAEVYAFFIPEKNKKLELPADLKLFDVDVAAFLEQSKFTGATGNFAVLPVKFEKKKFVTLLFAGLGAAQSKHHSIETFRRALGTVVKWVAGKKLESLAIALPQASLFGVEQEYLVNQATTISYIASYSYDRFITSISDADRSKVLQIVLCCHAMHKNATHGFDKAVIVGQAVNQTREWVDTPPSQLTPTILADHAKKLSKTHNLSCTVFGKKDMEKMGMGGILGVAAGSDQEPKLVIMEYKAKKAKAETIAFVGKGITFDSGGLSIKPANSMEEMKEDMAGAASVINALAAIAQLKPDVNVVGIAPITENLLGGSAQKPGDIITFYNGKTAEVRNTDAEGRLVLADALAYAVKNYKLDAIIDVATLTGACIYAVGPFFSALISDNDELSAKVQHAAATAADPVWRLPFTTDFKEAIKSHIADIQNVGNPSIAAGTITAGWFLRTFTDTVPWVHLDIASSAYNVPNISYYSKGATGSSVRLLIDVAMQWKQ